MSVWLHDQLEVVSECSALEGLGPRKKLHAVDLVILDLAAGHLSQVVRGRPDDLDLVEHEVTISSAIVVFSLLRKSRILIV